MTPANRRPHPHAGLERGIVHNEHVEAAGEVRILQLWIGLPASGLARFYWHYQEGSFTPLSDVVKAQRSPASSA